MSRTLMTRRTFLELAAVAAESASALPAAAEQPFALDASRLPFSCFGSYLAIGPHFWNFNLSEKVTIGPHYIRCLQDDANPAEVFRLAILQAAKEVHANPQATPGSLKLTAPASAQVSFCIEEADVIHFQGQGCSLQLMGITGAYSSAVQIGPGTWLFMPDASRSPVQVTCTSGSFEVDAPWHDRPHNVQTDRANFTFHPGSDGTFEGDLLFYEGVPRVLPRSATFVQSAAQANNEFEQWAAKVPTLSQPYESQRKLAAYVLWSNTVNPRGLYRTPVVLGSKSWMNRIWSWDHCFAALGLARSHPELAWQQFMIFRAMQDPVSGMLADSMTNVKRSWVCTKNPVHGWTLGHLMRTMRLTNEQMAEAYEPLRSWTDFWTRYRDFSADGLPCLLHPNESFDNTTSNTMDGAVRAPETATYLILQMDALAEVSSRLGHSSDEQSWRARSDKLTQALLSKLWDPKTAQFHSKRVSDNRIAPGDCVLNFMPLLLGQRLPQAHRNALIDGLLKPGRFLTPHGLSTEALTSPFYDPNSYVKGPTWAPIDTLLAEALNSVGQPAAANRIRQGFLNCCLTGGMSEHFDATSGAPKGDPGYIWTAALYLWHAAM